VGLTVVMIVIFFFAAIGLATSGQPLSDQGALGLWAAVLGISLVLQWLYFAGLESSGWQGTIGKRLLRLIVTDLRGRRIGFGRATGRYFGKLLLVVGGWFVLFTQRRQGLHDLMASTLVVQRDHLSLITAPLEEAQPQASPGRAGEVLGA